MKPRKVEKRSITYRKRNHPRDRLSRRRIDLVSVAPQWPRIASLLTKAMTESRYQEAEAKCENGFDSANRVERWALYADEARALAIKLRGCRPHHRCHSPACPECARTEQLLMALITEQFALDHENECFVTFVTIIPPNSLVPKGSLSNFDFSNFKRRVRDGLAKTSALWAVGSVGFTLNEHKNHLHPPHWSPHVHLIVGTNDIDKLKRDLGAAFPGSEQAPKPVMVKECDGNPKVFFYLYRPSFQRRISIEQTERFNRRTKKKRLCRATTYDRLRISERIELALFLDALGPGSRLSFRNARLCQARNSIRLQLVTT